MSLSGFLDDADRRYDAQERMLRQLTVTPGYHTRIAQGTLAHPTRETVDYAIALLQSGQATRAERACTIIERVVALQVTDPLAEHYGIWGWFLEETPQQMAPADWNWAEFIGARLAQILKAHATQLRSLTVDVARTALRHAALSMFRRNVGAGYTNIAVMGGVAAAAAGELLDIPFLLEFGRQRLDGVVQLAEKTGGFSEYNSPTYTRVALEEAERGLLILHDPACRGSAERLRQMCWETIAAHFHPATGQIAGPQSRAYSDRLAPPLAWYLHEQAGAQTAPAAATASKSELYCVVPSLPCPSGLATRFAALPKDPWEQSTRFGVNIFGQRVGTSYFTRDFTLGSVSQDFTWVQRRPLLGYWRSEREPAVVLRARLIKNGQDFASGYTFQAQRGPRVLSCWSLCSGSGDFHITLDRQPNSTYPMSSLVLRYSLQGTGVSVKDLGRGRYALQAGDWQAIVYSGTARLGSSVAKWSCGGEGEEAWVQATLYDGPSRPLDCRSTLLVLGAGVEIIGADASPKDRCPTLNESVAGRQQWDWQGLDVDAPSVPSEFAW